MSWDCSLALVEEFSAADCLDGAQSAQLKSTRTAERSCFGGRKRGSSRPSLSGMMSEPSTADPGVASWTSSLRDSRASPSASPADGGVRMTTGTSGPKLSGCYAKYDRGSRSWRTYLALFPADTSVAFSGTWPKAGLMHGGACCRRPRWERRIAATGSGCWLTPRAIYGAHPGMKDQSHLTGQVQTWPTPTNSMVTTGDQEQARFSGSDPKRPAYADANKIYATPSAHPRTQTPRQVDHGVQLANQVGGQLNPAWVAWLMGWPIGWTALEPLATGRFRRWLRLFGGC